MSCSILRHIFRIAAASAVFVLITALVAATIVVIRARPYTESAARLAESFEKNGLRPSDLPPEWVEALLTIEDPAFHTHHGVDLSSPGAGWTTLTQGLVKLNYPGPMQGLIGKPRQSIIAMALNRALDKNRQLTLFLNMANLGHQDGEEISGFPRAAEHYFKKPVSELTRREFLGLVAMLPAPGHFHPISNPKPHGERVRRIEALLAGECSPTGWRDVYLEGCAW